VIRRAIPALVVVILGLTALFVVGRDTPTADPATFALQSGSWMPHVNDTDKLTGSWFCPGVPASGEEGVGLLYAGIQHGDHGASAVVSRTPCLIGFDERHTVNEHREEQCVVDDACDIRIEGERGALVSGQFKREEWDRLKGARHRARACGQSRQYLCDSIGNGLPLIDDRCGVWEVALRDNARRESHFHDHTSGLGGGCYDRRKDE